MLTLTMLSRSLFASKELWSRKDMSSDRYQRVYVREARIKLTKRL